MNVKRLFWYIAGPVFGLISLSYALVGVVMHKEYTKMTEHNPRVWEKTIKKFEVADNHHTVSNDEVMFLGSSNIRFWRNLAKDMHPIPTVNRGFGGAKINDITFYLRRIIGNRKPRAIVLFAGTNDIAGNPNDKSAEEIACQFRRLADSIDLLLPGTPLLYLPITPTTARWHVWAEARRANGLIEGLCTERSNVEYVGATPYFLNEQGFTKEELLWYDGVHLNRKGYKIWSRLVHKELIKLSSQSGAANQLSRSVHHLSRPLDTLQI